MVEYHLDMCDGMMGTMQRRIPAIASMFACTHGMHWTHDVGLCLRERGGGGQKQAFPLILRTYKGCFASEWKKTW